MKLLVVEDDADVRELVRIMLREEGHAVDTAPTVTDGALLARTGHYDALVLDVRLPDGSGVALARGLRRDGHATPILMLTAQGAPHEVTAGLDAGADDYLRKPFDVGELKARVRALLRRGGAAAADQLVVGHLVVNRLTRQAFVAGGRMALTAKEFGMLEHFALHAEQVVTRTDLFERVWERTRDPDSNVIDVLVGRVRTKLRAAAGRPEIRTVRGVGFVLAVAPEAAPAGAGAAA